MTGRRGDSPRSPISIEHEAHAVTGLRFAGSD
jgi:hypothetical protein